MKKKRTIGLLALAIILGSGVSQSAHAMGMNPALDKHQDSVLQTREDQVAVLHDVQDKLTKMLPYGVQSFDKTALHKTLNTNYANKGYPSQRKTKDGFTDNGKLVMNSLKQPLTQPQQIVLADMVRYYYFSFTSAPSFKPLSQDSSSNIQGMSNTSSDTNPDPTSKLNYMNYITLINTIKDNPNLTQDTRNKQLIKVESDLQNSIDTLYGSTNTNKEAPSSQLTAFGSDKNVTIPFSQRMYSYLQLLAAYQKSKPINDTLGFYSTIMDNLYDIKMYSVEIRQGDKDAHIDPDKLTNNINTSYKKVDGSLVQPMVKVVQQQNNNTKNAIDAANYQTDKLGQAGLTSNTVTDSSSSNTSINKDDNPDASGTTGLGDN